MSCPCERLIFCFSGLKSSKKGPKLNKAQKAKLQQEDEERRLREEGNPHVCLSPKTGVKWCTGWYESLQETDDDDDDVCFCFIEEVRVQAEKEEQERLERERKEKELEILELRVICPDGI